jgi:hypothetical protein
MRIGIIGAGKWPAVWGEGIREFRSAALHEGSQPSSPDAVQEPGKRQRARCAVAQVGA